MQLIRIITFTDRGYDLADRIRGSLPDHMIQMKDESQDMEGWLRESFELRIPILFISACGIAVRLIAPFVKDKYTDSAVIVADEAGHYVIPILSGHMGRGNRLADRISWAIGAQSILTTATDVNGLIAIDVFADINRLTVTDRDGVKRVSAKLLKTGRITMALQDGIGYDADKVPDEISIVPYTVEASSSGSGPATIADVIISDDLAMTEHAALCLKPRNWVMGIGCKKGTPAEDIDSAVRSCIESSGLSVSQKDIAAQTSIDLKTAEPGMLRFAAASGIPYITYSAEELNRVEGDFSASEFVKEVTGVDNVCERSALLYAGTLGSSAVLAVRKYAHDGVSVAIARVDKRMIKWV